MNKLKNEGVCRCCYQTFKGSAMMRHLKSCEEKKAQDEKAIGKAKKLDTIYTLKLSGLPPFWIYVEVHDYITLDEIDGFLRDVWLECCGHLSSFKIGRTRYESDPEMSMEYGLPAKSSDVEIKKIMKLNSTFSYEYDFGSTTQVEGKIIATRKGKLKDAVKILARNDIPEMPCSKCDAPATHFCAECWEFYCKKCLLKHDCGDEMALPVVNSPRMGICAYDGDGGFDTFKIPKKKAAKK